MPTLSPELLKDAPPSPHLRAMVRGYRWRRFEPELEEEFLEDFHTSHLGRIRFGGWLATVLYPAFTMLDRSLLPTHTWLMTLGIRVGLVVPVFLLTIWATYRPQWRSRLQTHLTICALATGLGTVAILGLAHGTALPYEGFLLVVLYTFLMAGLLWRPAAWTSTVAVLTLLALEASLGTPSAILAHHASFLGTTCVLGLAGAYFMEHLARTTFLSQCLVRDLAERDPLTALANRRSLERHLDTAWRQAERDRVGVALLMVDVDHFKGYNDRYGHAGGDGVLAALARVLEQAARRPLDLAARYGGEEFTLVWYDPRASEVPRMAEALLAAVRALALPHEGSPHGILTVSVGLTFTDPILPGTYPEALEAADRALYEAKAGGRNRVVIRMRTPEAASL